MKRALSLLIALVTVTAFMVVPSFASDAYESGEEKGTIGAITDFADVQAHFNIDESTASGAATQITSSNGSSATNLTIDFNTESIFWAGTAPTENTPSFVSFDGGAKWSDLKFSIGTSGDPANEGFVDFSKQLNKASTIWLTNALDAETKQPQKASGTGEEAVAAAIVWKFSAFEARPKLEKFTLDYLSASTLGDLDDQQWTLKAAGSQKLNALQIGFSKDKKTVVGGYGAFKENAKDGINIVSGAAKPGEKLVFLVRVAPTAKAAGSKTKKFSVSTLIKAPNLKVDYKKNAIKMKVGQIIGTASTATVDDAVVYADANFTALPGKEDPIVPKVVVKGAAETKPGLPIVLDDADYVHYAVQTAATEKKPASEVQMISVAPMSQIFETNVNVGLQIKGATVKLPKGYELAKLADAAKVDTKWKTSTKEAGTYAVRVKNAAKYNAKTNATTGATISGNLLLAVKMGDDGTAKKKPLAIASWLANSAADGSGTDTASAGFGLYLKAGASAAQAVSFSAENADALKGTFALALVEGDDAIIAPAVSPTVPTGCEVEYDNGTVTYDFSAIPKGEEAVVFEITFTAKTSEGKDAEGFISPTLTVTVTPEKPLEPGTALTFASDDVTVNATAKTITIPFAKQGTNTVVTITKAAGQTLTLTAVTGASLSGTTLTLNGIADEATVKITATETGKEDVVVEFTVVLAEATDAEKITAAEAKLASAVAEAKAKFTDLEIEWDGSTPATQKLLVGNTVGTIAGATVTIGDPVNVVVGQSWTVNVKLGVSTGVSVTPTVEDDFDVTVIMAS
jgi:hypothetical protein